MITERTQEVADYAKVNGIDVAADKYKVDRETVRRYIRESRAEQGLSDEAPDFSTDAYLTKIRETFSPEEIKAIASGGMLKHRRDVLPFSTWDGEEICFAHISDTHIGSVFFDHDIWQMVVDAINEADCDFVVHTGDVVDGMTPRIPDHVYYLEDLGYERQKQRAIDVLSMLGKPLFLIDGNHDRWYYKSGGAVICKDICEQVPDSTYIGMDYGTIPVNGIKIMLHHGDDGGGAYATSYRLQKIIEALPGGDKPNILLTGHDHKQCYIFERNVHALAGGAVCKQSAWMRSTRKANHTGFWIVRAKIEGASVKTFTPTFHSFYA